MRQLTFMSFAAFLLFINMTAFGQEKDITIITEDRTNDDGDFFAVMRDIPLMPDFDDVDMQVGMGPHFGCNDGACMGGGLTGMPDELKLTKEQTEKIGKIRNTSRKQIIPLKSDIQLKQIEMKELMDADSPDKTAVASKIKEIDALHTQIKINRMNSRIDCRNVLTKEQKEKMEQLRSERRMMHFDGFRKKMKFKREKRDE